jgi:hypothetical protein
MPVGGEGAPSTTANPELAVPIAAHSCEGAPAAEAGGEGGPSNH